MHPDDYPPALQWEAPVWWLYCRLHTQLRTDFKGSIIGLDYNCAIALMQSLGWPLDLGLELLQVAEVEILNLDK